MSYFLKRLNSQQAPYIIGGGTGDSLRTVHCLQTKQVHERISRAGGHAAS
jgi:hypothetical protein